MADITYPQRWLKEHQAITSPEGWRRPNQELLKCQKGLITTPLPAQWVNLSVTTVTADIIGDDDGLVVLDGLTASDEVMNFIAIRLSGTNATTNSKLRVKFAITGHPESDSESFIGEFFNKPSGILALAGIPVPSTIPSGTEMIVTAQGDPLTPYVEIARFTVLP